MGKIVDAGDGGADDIECNGFSRLTGTPDFDVIVPERDDGAIRAAGVKLEIAGSVDEMRDDAIFVADHAAADRIGQHGIAIDRGLRVGHVSGHPGRRIVPVQHVERVDPVRTHVEQGCPVEAKQGLEFAEISGGDDLPHLDVVRSPPAERSHVQDRAVRFDRFTQFLRFLQGCGQRLFKEERLHSVFDREQRDLDSLVRLRSDGEDVRLFGRDHFAKVGVLPFFRHPVPLTELFEHIGAHIGAGHQLGPGAGFIAGRVGIRKVRVAFVIDERAHSSRANQRRPVRLHDSFAPFGYDV